MGKQILDKGHINAIGTIIMIVVGFLPFHRAGEIRVVAVRLAERFDLRMAVLAQAQYTRGTAEGDTGEKKQAHQPRQIFAILHYHDLLI